MASRQRGLVGMPTRLLAVSDPAPRDYFDKARGIAAAILIAAGAAALIGTFLDWVTIEPPERVPANQEFRLDAFTGIETSDGPIVIGAGIAVILCALAVILRKRSLYGWIAFIASILIGAIAIADYRGIDGLFYDEMQRIGDPTPAFGLTLVTAAALMGLIGSVTAIAASPKVDLG